MAWGIRFPVLLVLLLTRPGVIVCAGGYVLLSIIMSGEQAHNAHHLARGHQQLLKTGLLGVFDAPAEQKRAGGETANKGKASAVRYVGYVCSLVLRAFQIARTCR